MWLGVWLGIGLIYSEGWQGPLHRIYRGKRSFHSTDLCSHYLQADLAEENYKLHNLGTTWHAMVKPSILLAPPLDVLCFSGPWRQYWRHVHFWAESENFSHEDGLLVGPVLFSSAALDLRYFILARRSHLQARLQSEQLFGRSAFEAEAVAS